MQDVSVTDLLLSLMEFERCTFCIICCNNKQILEMRPARQQRMSLYLFREGLQTSGSFPWAFLDYLNLINLNKSKFCIY